jgi:hypothetical protein
VEELLTTVILIGVTFALDFKDTVLTKPRQQLYYEADKSNNLPEVRPSDHHHLHIIGKAHPAGKRVSQLLSLTYSRRRLRTPVKSELSG